MACDILKNVSVQALVIDDEEPIVEIMEEFLKHFGFIVTATTSSLKALETFRAGPGIFDLVITDMTMPGMTGASLAEEILRLRPEIPIILCSGHSSFINEDIAKAMGIREYLKKPVFLNDLKGAIERIFGNHEE